MSDVPGTAAPDWYPDPYGRHQFRYFDGERWTEHVSSNGAQGVDPLLAPAPVPASDHSAARVQRQVQRQAGIAPTAQGGGTVFTEPILVVNQKWKVIEVNNEYAVHDQHGNQIGAVRQVGQSTAKKVARVLTSFDQFMTHHLQVVDRNGAVLLQVTRPAKWMKSRVIIQNAHGQEMGQVVQKNVFGKIRFSLQSGGHELGSINAENWRAWNFSIRDHADQEVARITKTWEGLAKTLLTSADSYVLQIHRPLDDPLLSLVVASALCVDTALKQDQRGLG